jgi:alkylation response protein AidB-like acyl-CoA dehydrogenase
MAVTQLLGRLADLRPRLLADAAQGEAERNVPATTIKELSDAGVFRLMVPKRHGGHQAGPRAMLDVSAAVAEADGGTGWVVALAGGGAWIAGMFGDRARDDVYGADPDARICGSLPAVGTSMRVEGGWRISGRWSYVSGSLHADWAELGFLAAGTDGADGDPAVAIVPVPDLELVDTWHMAGMRSSGSNTLVADNVFVPEHRVLPVSRLAQGEPATAHKDELIYHVPLFAMAAILLVGPLLGLGQAALEHVRTAAATKGIAATTFTRQADSTGFQMQLAEAATRIDCARLLAHRAANDIEQHANAETELDKVVRGRIRADAAHAAQLVVSAVNTLCDAHGSGGFAASSSLRRIWQDVNVGARHALLLPAVGNEVYGKLLLGIENTVSRAV